MDELFRGKYRTKSTRLTGWDYASTGHYFITICTKHKTPFLGQIIDTEMFRSPLGEIAQEFWLKIHDLQPYFNIDEFVIMPNHVHGILIINAPGDGGGSVETLHCNVSTTITTPPTTPTAATSQTDLSKQMSAISPQRGSLSAIIRSYKSAVTRWARGNGNPDFAWQARYYDHIIRNEHSLDKIRHYIINNPLKWEFDKENPDLAGDY